METCTERSASLDNGQEALWYLGGLRIIQALGEQPKEDRKILEYLEPAGTSTFSYAPYQEDTAFYVIEGEAIFVSGGNHSCDSRNVLVPATSCGLSLCSDLIRSCEDPHLDNAHGICAAGDEHGKPGSGVRSLPSASP